MTGSANRASTSSIPTTTSWCCARLASIQDKEVGSPIELRIKAASGWRLVEVVGTTVQWFGQRVVLLSLRDLTERRRYELATGHEARFRSLVHNAGSIIMLVSSVGTLESVSGAITRLLGHDPELLEQRPLLDIVDPADRTKLAGALTAASHGASSAHPVIGARRPAAPRRERGRALRAEHRGPARRPDGRGLRHLGARRHRAGGHRARARPGPLAPDGHPRLDRRRHPRRRQRRADHQRSTAASPRSGISPSEEIDARGQGHEARLRPRPAGQPRGVPRHVARARREPRHGDLRQPRVQGRARRRALLQGAARRAARSSAGSGASATPPTAPASKTSSSTGPSTTR